VTADPSSAVPSSIRNDSFVRVLFGSGTGKAAGGQMVLSGAVLPFFSPGSDETCAFRNREGYFFNTAVCLLLFSLLELGKTGALRYSHSPLSPPGSSKFYPTLASFLLT